MASQWRSFNLTVVTSRLQAVASPIRAFHPPPRPPPPPKIDPTHHHVVVAALPTRVVEAKAGETPCSICLVDEDNKGKYIETKLPCGHKFHMGCIRRWLNAAVTCPLCREKLPEVPLDLSEPQLTPVAGQSIYACMDSVTRAGQKFSITVYSGGPFGVWTWESKTERNAKGKYIFVGIQRDELQGLGDTSTGVLTLTTNIPGTTAQRCYAFRFFHSVTPRWYRVGSLANIVYHHKSSRLELGKTVYI